MSNILHLHNQSDDLLQCTIQSTGCRYFLSGKGCIMCNYGANTNVSKEELVLALELDLKPALKDKRRLLLGSYGSILDEAEISSELLDVILGFVSRLEDIQVIILETHYKTITWEKIQHIKDMLPNKVIVFEVGLESSNNKTLKDLGKQIDKDELLKVVNLVHNYKDMEISCNIMLGAPYKTKGEQLCDTVNSIQWALGNNFDSVVVFPMCIKPSTKLYELYKQGEYKPISSWMLAELLGSINVKLLDKVHISWYDDRGSSDIIRPITCDKCQDRLMDFYIKYTNNRDKHRRMALILDLWREPCECMCRRMVSMI